MIQNVVQHLIGIGQNGMVSLCLFVLVFLAILIWACLQKKSHLNLMARLPLEGDTEDLDLGKDSHE